MIKYLIIVISISFSLFGCKSRVNNDAIVDDSTKLKREWMLIEINGFNKQELINTKAFLNLTKPDIATSSMGCNSLAFSYKLSGNSKIKFSIGNATTMSCADMNLEKKFSILLQAITNYSVTGNQLILSNKSEKMVFIASDWD
jgi:heat shock protein HslJ